MNSKYFVPVIGADRPFANVGNGRREKERERLNRMLDLDRARIPNR